MPQAREGPKGRQGGGAEEEASGHGRVFTAFHPAAAITAARAAGRPDFQNVQGLHPTRPGLRTHGDPRPAAGANRRSASASGGTWGCQAAAWAGWAFLPPIRLSPCPAEMRP